MTYYTVNIDPSQITDSRIDAVIKIIKSSGEVREVVSGRQYMWFPNGAIDSLCARLNRYSGVTIDKNGFREVKGMRFR